jgi:hypothetical protein
VYLLKTSRMKTRVLVLLMCAITAFAGLASKKAFAGSIPPNGVCEPNQCGGAGECVEEGECYPGVGNTGSICGPDGTWVRGCTGD